MQVSIEKVTPEMASKWLMESQLTNRHLRQRKIKTLAKVIENNGWKLNGETIGLNGDLGLVNGFHRCHAIVRANKSITTVVCRGISNDALPTLDTGNPRTIADVLQMNGLGGTQSEVRVLGCAARIAVSYEESASTWMEVGRASATNDELLRYVEAHPDLSKSVEVGLSIGKVFRTGLTAGRAAGLHFVFSQKSQSDASEFFNLLHSGAIADPQSPVLLLRERLLADSRNKKLPRERVTAALVIKAWNAFRAGTTPKLIKFDYKKENFPEIL